MTIHVHLRDQDTGRCETTRAPISVEQVKGWCTNPDTHVVIRPVRDLNDHIRVDQYEVPDRLTTQVAERDGSCVHPWCTRPATSCDDDHCIPYQDGGPTSSDNIAPLCRRHHRTKTHGRWRYRFLRPGHYLWTHRPATATTATAPARSTSDDSRRTDALPNLRDVASAGGHARWGPCQRVLSVSRAGCSQVRSS